MRNSALAQVNCDKSQVNMAKPWLIAAELLVNVALPRLIAIGDCWLMQRGWGLKV